MLASLASAAINVVLVARTSRSRPLAAKVATATLIVTALGLAGALATARWMERIGTARMHRLLVCSLAGALALQAAACGRARPQEPERQPAEAASAANTVSLSTRLSRPAPERIVAIGDLHGDLDHARRGLRLAGVVDEQDRWIGGSAVLVQTGDEIDRGDDDRDILDRIEDLKAQAALAGGEVIALSGQSRDP